MESLRRLRTEKGLSQARLAARAELDPSTVNQIERGAREASPVTLRKLADALDVGIAELLEDSGSGKAQRRSSSEPPLFNGLEDERRQYPYPWLADTIARALAEWTRIVEAKENAFYSRTIAVICFDLIDAVTLGYREGWDNLPVEEKPERRKLAEALDDLAMRGFEHYKASKAAQEAEVHEIERRREEMRRRTREISA